MYAVTLNNNQNARKIKRIFLCLIFRAFLHIINKNGKDTSSMHETKKLEFKETITNTFLKTVSAFSNYDGGEIFFGIDDNGNVKGMPNVRQSCLDIENKINDSI